MHTISKAKSFNRLQLIVRVGAVFFRFFSLQMGRFVISFAQNTLTIET